MKLAYSRGFTLIELLVVVSIISVLASVILVALSSARAAARDARRMSDMEQIYTALVSFYNDHGCLPTPGLTGCITGENSDSQGWDYSSQGNPLFLPFLQTSGYLSLVPVDPINNMTGDGSPVGTYSYRYYCYNASGWQGGPGLHLGFFSEASGGTKEVIYSGIKAGNPTLWPDPNFVCK